MASSPAIRAQGLGKQYRIGQRESYRTLRDVIAAGASAPVRAVRGRRREGRAPRRETIWALRDFDLELDAGEVLGVFGRNGAGKSTLLKILSRITEPTRGYAEIHGRLGSLLEVGTGFHPELTGRENVYLNGAILGMRRSEIDRKFDEIVEFAEIARFLDTPVKRYSSGMYVRLAFAVAAHLEPEILVVDEVLAVGDSAFQKKCLGRMGAVAREGRTVVLVSHNMGAISELCTRAVLLDRGAKVEDSSVGHVLEAYTKLIAGGADLLDLEDDPTLACSIRSVRFLNDRGMESTTFDVSEPVTVAIDYRVRERLYGLQLALTLSRNMVDLLHTFDTDEADAIEWIDPGDYEARLTFPGMFLKGGQYTLRLNAGTPDRLIHDVLFAGSFDVEELSVNTYSRGYRMDRPGLIVSPGTWERARPVGHA